MTGGSHKVGGGLGCHGRAPPAAARTLFTKNATVAGDEDDEAGGGSSRGGGRSGIGTAHSPGVVCAVATAARAATAARRSILSCFNMKNPVFFLDHIG
jgi:hypothetical protein